MRRLLLLVPLLSLAACDAVLGGPPRLDAVDTESAVAVESAASFQDVRDAWEVAEIDDYAVAFEVSCFCEPSAFYVRVEGGAVVEVWENGDRLSASEASRRSRTVPDLLDLGEEAFDRADRVVSRALPGVAPFLVSLDVDYVAEIADDEISYTLTGFERL